MKRTNPDSKPYLSFCLIVRNASETLDACLKSLRDRAPEAEIVIVDTCSNDLPIPDAKWAAQIEAGDEAPLRPRTHSIARRYADVFEEYTGPNGTWNREMYAFDDAAAARNESFRLASGAWVCWIDADDVIPPADEAVRLLTVNARFKPATGAKVIEGSTTPVSLIDFLRGVEQDMPQVEGFWCPYLYRFEEGPYEAGKSEKVLTWQTRERIVKNNGNWTWARKAHEVLVPKNPQLHAALANFPHLLFVHCKKFSHEDQMYSLRRHFDILIKGYDAGERDTQSLLYLENFATFLCPSRRGEFVKEAYEVAYTAIDRARVLIRSGALAAENGLFLDAVEAYAAAIQVAPEYPDTYFAMAQAYSHAEQHLQAAEWYRKGVMCPVGHPFSDVAPRSQLIEHRIRAALAYQSAARQYLMGGGHAQAKTCMQNAAALANEAATHPAIGPDKAEAVTYWNSFENEARGMAEVENLHGVWDYLVKNEEVLKAYDLIKSVPHNMMDHPLAVAMEVWGRKIQKHVTDPKAYQAFYENQEEVGAVTSVEERLTYLGAEPRVRFLIDWVKANNPRASVLEVGAFDGITVIPLLKELPNVSVYAVEAQKAALDRLAERCGRLGLATFPDGCRRVNFRHGLDSDTDPANPFRLMHFDVVVFHEVIEHVPDPVESIHRLIGKLRINGRLFLSTPWGAYDRGHPYNLATRDPRGHVRAMMPQDLIAAVEAAGGRVVELGGFHTVGNAGDTIHCMVERTPVPRTERPVSFVVPSALWDWNATHVENTGIGASEETIVYLARQLGRERRSVDVFGPIPKAGSLYLEEVRDRVKYWPREKWRNIDPNSTVIVSRGPSMGAVLDERTGTNLDKVLWLQDAWYPDLTPAVADTYRRIVVLTEWHKAAMHVNHGVPVSKMAVIPNFLLREHFAGEAPVREPHRFIYASSPDRGLITLLKIWPKILAMYPDAKLGIFYGWDGAMRLGCGDPGWNKRFREARMDFLRLKDQPGIEDHGRVNHARIAREYQRASAFLYPTDFDETGCCHPDTMISIPGDHHQAAPVRVPLASLVGKTNFPVYAYDSSQARFRIATAEWVKQTKIAPELVELELDDGSKLRLTDDHLVMTFDDEWVEAGDLVPGDRLRALHHRYDVMIKDADGTWVRPSFHSATRRCSFTRMATIARRMAEDPVFAAQEHARRVSNGNRTAFLRYGKNHRVVATRRIPGGPVFNMEVTEFHNFVADGVVVHNCLSAAKSRAAGCVVVCTPRAALNETADCHQTQFVPRPDHMTAAEFEEYAQAFVAGVRQAVDTPQIERDLMSAAALKEFDLETILPLWKEVLK